MQKVQSEAILGKKIEVKKIQPLLKIRNPISSGIKKNKDSKLMTNGLEHLENLNLYSLKLGLIRDLISLSNKYQDEYSMRARFSKILKLSKKLDSLLQISAERIRIDTEVRDGLAFSLDRLNHVKVERKHFVEEEKEDDGLVKICSNISGVYCISQISYNRNFSQFDINVYSQNDHEIYSYHLSQPLKSTFSHLVFNLNSLVLPRLYFSMFQDRIVLRFRESTSDEESIVSTIKGIPNKTCITISEKDSEFLLKVLDTSSQFTKSNFKIASISEMKDSGKRSLVRTIIEQNLSFSNCELNWNLSQLTINKSLNITTPTNLVKKTLCERRDKLEQFEEVIISESMMIKNLSIKVDLIFNNFLQKNRIFLTLGQISVKILQEEHEKDFKKMKKLQNVEICSVTMLKSLEFLEFLNKTLFD